MEKRLFTSESVTDGHPDKICDQLSDAVLDACLAADPNSRVACECCVTTGLALVMGEVTTNANLDIPAIAREVICSIGYDDPNYYYRPRKNIVNRPVSRGGLGWHFCGDHQETIPNLYEKLMKE